MADFRDLAPRLEQAARHAPAITLTGPRQSGKTTLSRAVFPGHPYVSLEAPDVRSFAVDDPRGFLAQFPRGAIIDEVQLFAVYGGDQPQSRTQGQLVPWAQLHESVLAQGD